jgi:hypothetical protein
VNITHHETHTATAAAASHEPHAVHAPRLPQVTDEAGETPGWVPALGIGLFAVFALIMAANLALRPSQPSEPPTDEAIAVEPVVAAPEPAADPHAGHGH